MQPRGLEIATSMGSSRDSRPRQWSEICCQDEYRGRWVALDGVRYDEVTAKPMAGVVVDVDDDLGTLCNRVRQSNLRSCAILFCDMPEPPPTPLRSPRGRTATPH